MRWLLASLVTPSNCRYAIRSPASLHCCAKPGSCAKRTPLARIRLELELLGGEHSSDLVEGIQHDIEEMEELISQTLLLARGLGTELRAETDIGALVSEVVETFRASGKTIVYQPRQKINTTVRPGALKRVLANLIDNAVIHGGGETVSLTCGREEDHVNISVIDQGPGIPAEQQEAVFQPFYRIDDSRSRQTGGSGLGLAIVRQLCKANGWEIGISSPPSGGAIFRLCLPNLHTAC